ncbi:hypothetical protein ACHAPT_000706 [Fusarium lateritium]
MDSGIPRITLSHPQATPPATPKGSQVELATGELSPKARAVLWKALVEPAVVEFYPNKSKQDQQVRFKINMMVQGSHEGLTYFQRTHRIWFQDSNYQWSRMNVVKDTLLTVNMTLPTPKIPWIGADDKELSAISLPIQNLASSFYNTIRPDGRIRLGPLCLKLLPALREFTMACPKQCGGGMPSTTAGDWYGFRYHVSTHQVEFTLLSGKETLETGLAGKDPLTGLLGTVVRLWIVRPGEEGNSERKRHHKWKEFSPGLGFSEPGMKKAWRVWQLTRTRFENPVRAKPLMLIFETGR